MQGRLASAPQGAGVRSFCSDFRQHASKQIQQNQIRASARRWRCPAGCAWCWPAPRLTLTPYDMSCFVAWGDKPAAEGPASFYSEGYFVDYPPGCPGVLGLVGQIALALHIAYELRGYIFAGVVPSLCDCGLAWLVYRTAKRARGREGACRAGADGVYGVQPADAVPPPVSGSRSTARFAASAACFCFVLLEQPTCRPPPCCMASRWPPSSVGALLFARCWRCAIWRQLRWKDRLRLWPLLWRRGAGTAAAAADSPAFLALCS